MGSMGLNTQTGINGVYNLFDKDGYHYPPSDGKHAGEADDAHSVPGLLVHEGIQVLAH